MPGIIFRTSTPVHAPTAGAKMESAASRDYKQRLCLAFAFWNGRDPILKERLFGVTGPQGSHGEDVKEVYFYTDCTPTHSYMRMLYRYPQARFPYEELVAANHGRPKEAPEFELWDTGILRDHRYFDISLEYAKVDPDDLFIRVTATNRGPEAAHLHILPTTLVPEHVVLGTGRSSSGACAASSDLAGHSPNDPGQLIAGSASTSFIAKARAISSSPKTKPTLSGLFGSPNTQSFRQRRHQRFHRPTETGSAVNPEQVGTKAAAHYAFPIEPGASAVGSPVVRTCGRRGGQGSFGRAGRMPRHSLAFQFWIRMRSSISKRFFRKRRGGGRILPGNSNRPA